jgi:hypothetical protein
MVIRLPPLPEKYPTKLSDGKGYSKHFLTTTPAVLVVSGQFQQFQTVI